MLNKEVKIILNSMIEEMSRDKCINKECSRGKVGVFKEKFKNSLANTM